MNKLEMIGYLSAQLKKSTHSHEELVEVFDNYKTMVMTLSASGADYNTSLRRLREEFPDIDRVILKKHDPILKGRLIDALSAFKKKVEEIENKDQEPEAPTAAPEVEGEEKRVRNIPNLGMS